MCGAQKQVPHRKAHLHFIQLRIISIEANLIASLSELRIRTSLFSLSGFAAGAEIHSTGSLAASSFSSSVNVRG
jgi:hypothetical protein